MSSHKRRPSRPVIDSLESRTLLTISLADPSTYPVAGNTITAPALADFNGDGFLDAATSHTFPGQNSLSVLLNQGDGTYGMQTPLGAGNRPFQVIAGDFNNDAKQDLAFTNIVDGTVSVLLGNGDGTFQPRVNTQVGATAPLESIAPEYLVAGNLNGDAFLDLVVYNSSESEIVSLVGVGDGTFTRQDSIAGSFGAITLGDFSGDGQLDVATNRGDDAALAVYFTDGAGNLDDGHFFDVANLAEPSSAEGVAAGDFNGDGRADVAMLNAPFNFNSTNTALSVFLSNGDGTFQPNINTPISTISFDLAAGDVDNDGKVDVVVSEAVSGFQALRGNGDGTFVTPPDVIVPEFAISGVAAIGDLDNNGVRDVAFAHFTPPSTFTLAVFLSGTPGGGGSGFKKATPTVQATLPAAVVAGEKVKGAKVSVLVTNDGTEALNDSVGLELFVSTDALIDSNDTPVGAPIVKKLKIIPGLSKAVKLKLATLPNVPDGDYFLLARTSASGVTGGTSASAATVNIAAPFVDLSGTFGSPLPTSLARGKKASVPVTITNAGNVPASGTINVALSARPSPAPGTGDVVLPTAPVKLKLKPGASRTLRLKITTPDTLTAGTYSLLATIDSPSTLAEKLEDNNDLTSSSTLTVT